MNEETKSYKEDLWLIDKTEIFNFILLILGIIITNVALCEIIKTMGEISIKFVVFTLFINAMLSYFAINLIMSKLKIKKLNEYIEFLNERNEGLMELNDNIRSFKHDFNNIIQAIDGYILIGDMEALKVYFAKLLEECNHLKNLEILACSKMVNPAIYGVLINKYRLAESKNIKMNIDVLIDFTKIGSKSYCLSRTIGILLDNAIEAALECDRKIINVQFGDSDEIGAKRIVVENTFKSDSFDKERIFEKNYTTKRKKGNSGIGLWKVRNMIDRDSDIFLNTTSDNDMFKQEIKIYSDR